MARECFKKGVIYTKMPNFTWIRRISNHLRIERQLSELCPISKLISFVTNIIKPKKYPRQFCYVGTTNDLEFLTDPTSNRRFWVFVNEGEIDKDAIILMRDQLWAQEVALFVAGEKWWLSRETENQMAEVAEQFEIKMLA